MPLPGGSETRPYESTHCVEQALPCGEPSGTIAVRNDVSARVVARCWKVGGSRQSGDIGPVVRLSNLRGNGGFFETRVFDVFVLEFAIVCGWYQNRLAQVAREDVQREVHRSLLSKCQVRWPMNSRGMRRAMTDRGSFLNEFNGLARCYWQRHGVATGFPHGHF